VLGRVVRRVADEWLRVDDEPRLPSGPKDIPGVQVGCQQDMFGGAAR